MGWISKKAGNTYRHSSLTYVYLFVLSALSSSGLISTMFCLVTAVLRTQKSGVIHFCNMLDRLNRQIVQPFTFLVALESHHQRPVISIYIVSLPFRKTLTVRQIR